MAKKTAKVEGNAPAPVLSLSEQKKSISCVKDKKKKVVLNTLDSPLDLDWPKLEHENEEKAISILKEKLLPVRIENLSVSKETLANVPKEERAEWRKQEKEKKKASSSDDKSKMSEIIVGFRDVIRAVGKNQVCMVICEKSPDPPLLTKLLVPLCRTNGIALLAAKNFTASVSVAMRIPRCLMIALKPSAKEASSPLHELYNTMMDLYKSCGLPETSLAASELPLEHKVEAPCRVLHESVSAAERFYLKRTGQGCRFVPGVSENPLGDITPAKKSSAFGADYIALSGEPTPELPKGTASLRYHRIKQIQPNENKKKKNLHAASSTAKKSKTC